MKAPWFALKVDTSGDFFKVESESGHAAYTVDPMANNGKGQCDCTDWKTRVPALLRGDRIIGANEYFGCKHLMRVHLLLGLKVIQEFSKLPQYKERFSP